MSVPTEDKKHSQNVAEKSQVKEEVKTPKKVYSPNVDVVETHLELIFYVEMPGVNETSVQISLEKDELTIEGNFEAVETENLGQVRLAEFRVGNYFRRFTVTKAIDSERAVAKVKQGILELRLPKIEPKKTKIQITN